jgi:hypothetical protein
LIDSHDLIDLLNHILHYAKQKILTNVSTLAVKIKELLNGNIVGSGSDYLVIQKEKKRYYIEILPLTLKEFFETEALYQVPCSLCEARGPHLVRLGPCANRVAGQLGVWCALARPKREVSRLP